MLRTIQRRTQHNHCAIPTIIRRTKSNSNCNPISTNIGNSHRYRLYHPRESLSTSFTVSIPPVHANRTVAPVSAVEEAPLFEGSHEMPPRLGVDIGKRRSTIKPIDNCGYSRLATTTTALLLLLSSGSVSTVPTSKFAAAFSTTAVLNKNQNTSMMSSSTSQPLKSNGSTGPLSSTTNQDINSGSSSSTTTAINPHHPLANLSSNFTHTWIRNLSPETPTNRLRSQKFSRSSEDDGVSNNVRRPVYNGHYVPVRPKPLSKPRLVLYSPAMARDLGIDETSVYSQEFARYFSGDVGALDGAPVPEQGVETWATPYALSIMGTRYTSNCPFGTGDGYGDGRAIYIGEVSVPSSPSSTTTTTNNNHNHNAPPERYELQLKGAGPTPFCRGADGRAVLRSSLREFLASEAMHALGVSTTRALSLIVSDGGDTSTRPWYSPRVKKPPMPDVNDPRLERYGGLSERKRVIAQISSQSKADPDVMIQEPNAITCRVARSFVRVGHFDLFARRVRALSGNPEEDVPEKGTEELRELEDLVWHAAEVEFPDTCYRPFKEKGDVMGAGKCLIEASMEGISTMVAEWLRVGFAQGNFNGDNCLLAGRTMDYGPFGFMDEYSPLFAKWTGSGEHFGFMNQPNAGYANFAVLASSIMPVIEAYGESMAEADAYEESIMRKAQKVFEGKVAAVFRVKMGFHPSDDTHDELWSDLESILGETRADWTLFWRRLTDVAKEYPIVVGRNEDEAEVSTSYGEMLTLLEGDDAAKPGSSAFYTSLDTESKAKLLKWIQSWREALVDSYSENGTSNTQKDNQPVLPPEERMRISNPKYVLREWMMVEAYSKASPETVSSSTSIFKPSASKSQRDESLIHDLFELILNPYDEGTEEQEKKYFRRAPDEALAAGGTAFMS